MKSREEAVLSIVAAKPIAAAQSLVPAFYDKNNPLSTRFGILSWLAKGAKRVSIEYSGKPDFAEYVKTTITGLCGGAGWSRLEFAGLDAQIVSHLLNTTGLILKAGRNLSGWDQL